MKKQQTFFLISALVTTLAVHADLVEPDHVIYGDITVDGQPVADGTEVSLLLAATAEQLVRYRVGDEPGVDGRFVLRIPMESGEPRLPGRARPDEDAIILVNGQQAAQVIIGEYGGLQELAIDPGNLSGFALLSADDVAVLEGDAGVTDAVIDLTLNRDSEAFVSIDWSTTDGTALGGSCPGADFAHMSGTATIPGGSNSAQITIEICGDLEQEADEVFTVDLTNVTGAQSAVDFVTVTVENDDFELVEATIADAVGIEPLVASDLIAFEVQLESAAPEALRLNWSTRDGSAVAGVDYESDSGTLEIAEGETAGLIEIAILADAETEPNENFFLVIDSVEGLSLAVAEVAGTIIDPAFDPSRAPDQELVNGRDGVEGLRGGSALAVSTDNRTLFAAGTTDDRIVQIQRDITTGRMTFRQSAGSGALGVGLDGISDVAVGSDVRFVFAVSRGTGRADALMADTSGANALAAAPGGGTTPATMAGAVAGAVDNEGHHLYVVAEQSNAINAHTIDPLSGALTWIQGVAEGFDDPDDAQPMVTGLLGPRAVVISRDGDFVYVAAKTSNTIAIFSRQTSAVSPAFGQLGYVGAFQSSPGDEFMIAGPRALALSADSRFLYVASETTGTLVVLNRASNGNLSYAEGFGNFMLPSAIAVSPDDLQMAVTDFSGDAVHVFERLQSGLIRSADVRRNGQPGITQLDGPADIVYSRDGAFVYVVSANSGSVTMFQRFASEQIFRSGFE